MQDKLPRGSLGPDRSYSRYAITAVNLYLAPDIRMQIVPERREVQEHLLVTVDEAAVLATTEKAGQDASGIASRAKVRRPRPPSSDYGCPKTGKSPTRGSSWSW